MGIGSCAGIALPGRVQIAFRKRRIVVGRDAKERLKMLALRKPHLAHRTVVSPYLHKSSLLCYRRFHNKPITGLVAELNGDNSTLHSGKILFSPIQKFWWLIALVYCFRKPSDVQSTITLHSVLQWSWWSRRQASRAQQDNNNKQREDRKAK